MICDIKHAERNDISITIVFVRFTDKNSGPKTQLNVRGVPDARFHY